MKPSLIFSVRETGLLYQCPVADPIPIPFRDTIRPTIAITVPTNGATVSGTQTITAVASDNVDIASVRFSINGVNFGSPVLGPGPYTLPWDTLLIDNGPYEIIAVATDTSGNQTVSAAVDVTVFNISTEFCSQTVADLTGFGTEWSLFVTNLGATSYDTSSFKIYELGTDVLLQTSLHASINGGDTSIVILDGVPGIPPNGFYMTYRGVTFFTYPTLLTGHNIQVSLGVNC